MNLKKNKKHARPTISNCQIETKNFMLESIQGSNVVNTNHIPNLFFTKLTITENKIGENYDYHQRGENKLIQLINKKITTPTLFSYWGKNSLENPETFGLYSASISSRNFEYILQQP